MGFFAKFPGERLGGPEIAQSMTSIPPLPVQT